MLVLAWALMSKPKLMMLDETYLGLAPLITDNIFSLIEKLREEKDLTILLVEQNASMPFSLTDYGYVLENGRIVLFGSSEELRKNEDIKEFYHRNESCGRNHNFSRRKTL